MIVDEIKKLTKTAQYDFLRTNPYLGSNIILLGLGGSHAYGTNIDTSDIDIRGIALNPKNEILLGSGLVAEPFEQVVDIDTDTVIYSFNKIIQLLLNVNPNTIELLGLEPWQYLYVSPIGQELLDNKHLFLSKKCIQSFGGYANQQLYRLNQKAAHQLKQAELEKHILKTLEFMQVDFKEKYTDVPTDALKLYVDTALQKDFDTEIFMDVNLTHYPLRDYCSMWNELQNTVKQYAKIGKRNEKALEHGKIAKHAMHLVRLYLMCFDILEKGEIKTYRENDLELLRDIRNGKYLDENDKPTKEFFDMVDSLEARLEFDKEHTDLPDLPDYDKIREFTKSVNERIVKDELKYLI